MYQVRNRFQQGLAAEVGGPGPIRQITLGGGATSPTGQGPVVGSGPGYAAANLARPAAMGGPESDEEKAYGNLQRNANSAEEFNRNKQQFEFNQGLPKTPKSGEYAGQATQGTSVTNGQFNASEEQKKYMAAQIAAAAKNNAVKKYARGGRINEPVKGIGQRTGNPYLFGERGPEQVTPIGSAQRANAPEQPMNQNDLSEEQMLQELQKILGRRVFAKNRKPIRGAGALSPEASDQNTNTGRAVNSPVLRLGEDEIRQIAQSGQHGNLIRALQEAETRGGVEIVSGSGLGASQGMGGSAVENNATPNEQAIMDEEAAAAAAPGPNEYFPGFDDPASPDYIGGGGETPTQYEDPDAPGYASPRDYSEGDLPAATQYEDPAAPGYASPVDYSEGDSAAAPQYTDSSAPGYASQIDYSQGDVAPPTQYEDSTAPGYASPVDYSQGDSVAAPQYTDTTAPAYASPVDYSQGDSAQATQYTNPTSPGYASPVDYSQGDTSSVSAYTPPAPTQQSFDQAALDKMLADALARSGYGTTSTVTDSHDNDVVGPPPTQYTDSTAAGYASQYDYSEGDTSGIEPYNPPAETDAERMMRLASGGHSITEY